MKLQLSVDLITFVYYHLLRILFSHDILDNHHIDLNRLIFLLKH